MKKNATRITAIICIVLLVLLYLATLIVALLDFPGSEKLFGACLFATIAMPILLWIYIYLFGKFTGRDTIAGRGRTDHFPDADMLPDEDVLPDEESSGDDDTL